MRLMEEDREAEESEHNHLNLYIDQGPPCLAVATRWALVASPCLAVAARWALAVSDFGLEYPPPLGTLVATARWRATMLSSVLVPQGQ